MRRRGMDVAVDSSGFSFKTSSKWFDIRIKRQSSKKDYLKLHVVIDVETNVILQFTITDWRGSDSREFKRLISDLPRLGKAAADKAYSSRVNCQAVAEKKGQPFIAFKANATGRAKGYPAWQISFGHTRSIRRNGGTPIT
jgi:transposase